MDLAKHGLIYMEHGRETLDRSRGRCAQFVHFYARDATQKKCVVHMDKVA